MIIGFATEAIGPEGIAQTVDATIGLEHKLVLLIMEVKCNKKSFQYDLKRLVPALTRCSRGLVVMWKNGAMKKLPMQQLADGPKGVLKNLVSMELAPDPRVVGEWF